MCPSLQVGVLQEELERCKERLRKADQDAKEVDPPYVHTLLL